MNKFAKVPQALLDASWKNDAEGGGYVLAVYSVLARHMNWKKRDAVYPGLERIADQVGASVSSVRRALDLLEEYGWISRVSGTLGRTTRYTVYENPEDNPDWEDFDAPMHIVCIQGGGILFNQVRIRTEALMNEGSDQLLADFVTWYDGQSVERRGGASLRTFVTQGKDDSYIVTKPSGESIVVSGDELHDEEVLRERFRRLKNI